MRMRVHDRIIAVIVSCFHVTTSQNYTSLGKHPSFTSILAYTGLPEGTVKLFQSDSER